VEIVIKLNFIDIVLYMNKAMLLAKLERKVDKLAHYDGNVIKISPNYRDTYFRITNYLYKFVKAK